MSYGGGSGGVTGPARRPGLLDEVRRRVRLHHYSLRTEQAYVGWVRRFVQANGRRHPRDLGAAEVESFLSALATEGNVAAGTQNQALSALLFLYREVLQVELPWLESVVRAKRPQRVPTVLSREEVRRLLAALDGRDWLMAALLFGTGMRLLECLRLRVKYVDFARNEITVRDTLYFGRSIPGGGRVDDAAWARFEAEVLLPAFPQGYSLVDAHGRWRGADGSTASEDSRLAVLVHADDAASAARVREIAAAYRTRFHQEAVLRERSAVCTAF